MSRITKAVILAAGMGLRMKEMGEEIPKGFIRLGGSPIIEHSLRALISCGIKEIMIVTGHKGGYYENLKATYPEIRTIENTKFTDTGTMYSLCCARDFVDADFILLESDLIFDPGAITSILNVPTSIAFYCREQRMRGMRFMWKPMKTAWPGSQKTRIKSRILSGSILGSPKFQNIFMAG